MVGRSKYAKAQAENKLRESVLSGKVEMLSLQLKNSEKEKYNDINNKLEFLYIEKENSVTNFKDQKLEGVKRKRSESDQKKWISLRISPGWLLPD